MNKKLILYLSIFIVLILLLVSKQNFTSSANSFYTEKEKEIPLAQVKDTYTNSMPIVMHNWPDNPWPMAGANSQRTSWVPASVDPESSNNFGVAWYRPIEAYIGQHVQLIAARGKIFASTSKGLYALDYETGDVEWQFNTEMPLGHSPTVSGNQIFVGGFDRRVYGLLADTGELLWTFSGAKAGFSTNPLVEEGKVLLGGRDGYFYALDQNTGSLVWQYPLSNQPPLASILYSAAYKDGKVFFAAMDNYAYALDASSGNLIWKSGQMPGDGFQAFWPTIYQDYVVFSSALPYADQADPGNQSVADVVNPNDPYYQTMHGFQNGTDFVHNLQTDDVFYQNEPNGTKLGNEFISSSSQGINWNWGAGKLVINAFRATRYLENDGQSLVNRPTNKPWRRTVIVLKIMDGSEYTFDSDGDKKPEYAPFLYTGTKSGNRYPPVIIPLTDSAGHTQDTFFDQNLIEKYGIPGTRLTGWQLGTPYLYPIGEQFAIDEPYAVSAAGNMLYESLCCDRIGVTFNLQNERKNYLWGYAGGTLETIKFPYSQIESWMQSLAPGYDEMWFGASMYDHYPRLYGNYGSMNGIYHNHGLQNPIIPYQQHLYIHRSNAIIAYGPNSVRLRQIKQNETPEQYEIHIQQEYPHIYKPLLKIAQPSQNINSTLTIQDVQNLLDNQISKILQSGHLRPGYFNSTRNLYQFANYFENPGDTLYFLMRAYPYASAGLKPDLEKYIKQHFKLYFENLMAARTGYWISNPPTYNLNDPNGSGQLQPREWMPTPPELKIDMTTHPASFWPGVNWAWEYPQYNFYAMWMYADTFFKNDTTKLSSIYDLAKSRLDSTPPGLTTLNEEPWIHNGYISGYYGFLKLQQLAGKTGVDAALRSTITTQLNSLLSQRVSGFKKDTPWAYEPICCSPNIGKRMFNIARNFLFMTPDLTNYLNANALNKVRAAVNEYEYVTPYWMAARYEAGFEEFATQNLYTNHALFAAKAYILKEPRGELLKYIDVPAFNTGDLFFIESLVGILESQP